MSPSEAIAMLDSQLAAHGEIVTIRRYTAPNGAPRPKVELVDIRGFVRAVSADDMVGDIKATASKVTFSPTDVATFWPLLDSDKVVIAGKERSVMAGQIKPKLIGGVLVRCDLVVSG